MARAIRWGSGSKYGAKPTVIDNVRFASGREASRYLQLKLSASVGEIAYLELQPRFPLHVAGVKVGTYIADFRYSRLGQIVIEDAKGVKTPVYRLKKRMVEAEYGITVEEV